MNKLLARNSNAFSIQKKMLLFIFAPIALIISSFVYFNINYQTDSSQNNILILLGGIVGILIILILILYVSKHISTSLKQLQDNLKKITLGDNNIDESIQKNISLEIHNTIQLSKDINESNKQLAQFASDIKNGILETNYNLLSEKDQVGQALLDIQKQLIQSQKEQEERQEEDRKRFWTSDGLARLNDILRKQDEINELSFKILSFLIEYLDANQGGVFIRNNDNVQNPLLELVAFYAFDRRKFLKKTFEFGEGLIGNCALEKETTHLTEIPQNYIQIKSGLGGSNPKSLLLVPMKIEEEVLGIIEIASFNTFEDYQIKFIEQASLIIASSLNMAETNKRTTELLERTQQQTEQMAAQEEEMRQNMEELQATQEESTRKAEEFEQKSDEIEKINVIMEKQLEKALRKIDKLTARLNNDK